VRPVAALLVVLYGCATVHGPGETTPATENAAAGDRDSSSEEHGIASYYGKKLAGHKTASGERYDPDKRTAAHRTLPFGMIVEVTRADGRSVRVRINDRGPFVKGRVIDLSRRAAEKIGLLRDGVADVTVSVVGQGDDDP